MIRLNPDVANATHRSSTMRHERRDADVDEPGEADVRIRQGVVDRRRDHGANLGRDSAGDLLWNQHVGQQRPVRTVLLGRAEWE